LALYLLLHIVILRESLKGLRSHQASIALLSAIVFGITVALFTQEFVNRIWKNPFLPYIYGWIVGTWATMNKLSETARVNENRS
jgi:hypothetical protein